MEEPELHELVRGEPFASALTPAVLIDTERVRENIATTLRYIRSPGAWRAHVKTARLRWTVDALLDAGVERFKASTLAEVELLLEAGARDVLLAYPAIGPTQWRLAGLAAAHPRARVSTLADHVEAVRGWRPGPVAAFLDVDNGGGRTGFGVKDADRAKAVAEELLGAGFALLGLHSYDGHLADLPEAQQRDVVAGDLHDLVRLAEQLETAGHPVGEIVTGGSHTFVPAAATPLPAPWNERVTFGPGTVVYNDLRSLDRFGDKGYRSAAFVLSRVVSTQGPDGVTLDAGLTTIQVDGGRPHARVIGVPAQVGAPSQEHLKVTVESGPVPAHGDPVLLVPRHVDTTLAQFDRVYLVGDGPVRTTATVTRPF
ncbi:alanine racemase [Streptomyces sp. TS71-3]|uniref:alanine racemase n=1 Tax=Streptomyces sp. TS71-3 TaxID=2733862 RepID=UPI001B08EB89|nr:alanine racemase [Streptomyces sp. TS71-3]GHJ39779.1 alanine racemase [Streptomyces sp. TS71-3]